MAFKKLLEAYADAGRKMSESYLTDGEVAIIRASPQLTRMVKAIVPQPRVCPHCGDAFVVGFGTGRRIDTQFCCNEHKVAFFNAARRKKHEL